MDNPHDAWRYNLQTYAQKVSGRLWIPYTWHRYLAARLTQVIIEQQAARIIINAPPQHGKSTLVSHWAPTYALDTYPDIRGVIGSYAAALATSWSEKVRDTFRDSKHTWGELNPDHSQKADWQLKETGGGWRSVGVGGGLSGFPSDFSILDDPHKDWEDSQSATMCARVINWFHSTFATRVSSTAPIIIIQTRWSENDLTGHLLRTEPEKWEHIRLPALCDSEDDPLGRAIGDPLCPERYSKEYLEDIQARQPRIFAGLYQQLPAPAGGSIIKRDWIQFYGGPTGVELPTFSSQIHSWDINAGKKTTAGSFACGQAWGKSDNGFYLLDQTRGRWPYVETKAKFKDFCKRWPKARLRYIEAKSGGIPLINEMRQDNTGIMAYEPKGSKEVRMEAVSPLFEAGDVWLPHPSIAPWVAEYVEEIVSFPGAANDDQADTTSQALDILKNKRKAVFY